MLPFRSQISIVRSLLAVLIISTVSVLADTDVMPFKLPLSPSKITIPQSEIFTLSPNTYPQVLNVSNEKPELWLSAPLEGGYKRWLARISWPGSMPTKFALEVLPHPRPTSESGEAVIIHISAQLLSPRLPRQPFSGHSDVFDPEYDTRFFTTFAIVVEPLIWGMIPPMAVPAAGIWVIIFGVGAACVVPYIIRYLNTLDPGPMISPVKPEVDRE